MIEQLDDILSSILSNDDSPVKEANIDFAIPKTDYEKSLKEKTVNLYLYNLYENRVLRDPVPIIELEPVDNVYVKRPAPLRVDCSYIITAWSKKSGDGQTMEEHQLLSNALLWLSRFPTIPAKFLPLDWKDKTKSAYQPFPILMWVGQMNGVKEPGEFWTALGQPPRPSFNLVVTIAMDLRQNVEEGPPVTTKDTSVPDTPEPKERLFQIAGRVFDVNSREEGIKGAVVALAEFSRAEITDEKGRFSFPSRERGKTLSGLAAGEYTLRVYAQGFEPKEKKIKVPGPSEEYEIGLGDAIPPPPPTPPPTPTPQPTPTPPPVVKISGRLFDDQNPAQGVAGAIIRLMELNKFADTDQEGRYSFPSKGDTSFPGLSGGEYTLRVIAAEGYVVPTEKKVKVPGPPGEYDIGLTRFE